MKYERIEREVPVTRLYSLTTDRDERMQLRAIDLGLSRPIMIEAEIGNDTICLTEQDINDLIRLAIRLSKSDW